MAAPLGQLVAWNVVSTFKVRISPTDPLLNLNTVALACSGKYNPSVFPAVVCAARLPEHGAGEKLLGECEYPLQPSRQKASAAAAAVVPAPRRKKNTRGKTDRIRGLACEARDTSVMHVME